MVERVVCNSKVVSSNLTTFSINDMKMNNLIVVLLIILASLGIIVYFSMIIYMINKGKVKAKGAKKRRKKILPFVYNKNKSYGNQFYK